MDNHFQILYRSVFNSDYAFITRFLPVLSRLGVLLHIFFYFFLAYIAHLEDSLPLRILCVAVILSRPLLLRKNITTPTEKFMYEAGLIFLIPFYFSYMTLLNDVNMVWATATGFCGFFYGLLSKAYIMPVGYIIGIGAASFAYSLGHTFDPELMKANFMIQPLSFFPALISAALIVALELYYKRFIEMETEQIALRETEKNYEKLIRTEKLLRENEEKYRLLVNNSSDAIFVLQNEKIQFVSRSATRITGYSEKELLNKSFYEFLVPHEMNRAAEQYALIFTDHNLTLKNQFEIVVKKGIHKWVEIDSVVNTWNDEPAVFNFLSDITEKKLAYEELSIHRNNLEELVRQRTATLEETNRELTKAKNIAEAATLSKNEFLANMSHEIRTPLNAVIGISDLLDGTQLSSKQKEYVEIVKASSKILLSLLNDILDFSKIEAGQMELEEIPFHLSTVIDDVSDIFIDKIQKKEIEFIIDVDPDVPEQIISDSLRLKQMLTNLISNALKFTEKGEISLGVSVKEKKEAIVTLEFRVRDTGIGIKPEKTETLFDAFSQADTSTTRKFGGTGLGLSITQKIAEMMRGSIRVESELDKGSTFIITAPFRYLSGTPAREVFVPEQVSRRNVLVVDDNPSTLMVMKRYIESFGMNARTAGSADEAIDLFLASVDQDTPYDLILIDVKMPDMDGIETINTLMKQESISIPPVIFMSSSGFARFRERFSTISPPHYLTKPVKQSVLFDEIMDIFGYSPEFRKKTRGRKTRSPDFKKAKVLLVEDNAINQMVATEILTGFNIEVHKAGTGYESVEILTENRFDLVLMDIQMPEMDGIEATRIIRKRLKLADLPVIAMTANAMRGDREKYLNAGMNDYLTKPIDNNRLIAILEKWIGISVERQDTETPTSHPRREGQSADLPEKLPGINIDSGLSRVNNNRALFLAILQEFYHDNLTIADTVREMIEANELTEAGKRLHNLKGAAGNISAPEIITAIKGLERDLISNRSPDPQYITRFEVAVTNVLKGLRPLISHTRVEKSDITMPDLTPEKKEEVRSILRHLLSLLQQNSLESDTHMKRLMSVLGKEYEDHMDPIRQRVAALDFETAEKKLRAFAETTGTL